MPQDQADYEKSLILGEWITVSKFIFISLPNLYSNLNFGTESRLLFEPVELNAPTQKQWVLPLSFQHNHLQYFNRIWSAQNKQERIDKEQ